jgi:tetratricopeptide (TPR) repeat protein
MEHGPAPQESPAPRPITEDIWWREAFGHLSPRARRHLPFVGLFASSVSLDILESFVGAGDKQMERYADLLGEALDATGWEAVLDEAVRCGLVLAVHHGLYDLPPALPVFLRRQLVAAAGAEALPQWGREFAEFYAAWAAHLEDDVINGQEQARRLVAVEEANLLQALRLAGIDDQWRLAQPIVRTLKELYEASDRLDEWHTLRTRLLDQVGRELPPTAGRDQAGLWLFLLGSEANAAQASGELDRAEGLHRDILQYLLHHPDSQTEPLVGVSCHQLGLIAEERGQLDLAEQRYRKALDIFQQLGLERSAADEYYQLGNIAQQRRQLDLAEPYYRQALQVYERRGLQRYAASTCQQLGRIAEERQQFEQAEQCYRQALDTFERLGERLGLYNVLLQLGALQRRQDHTAEAVGWYGRALNVALALGGDAGRPARLQLARAMRELGEPAFAAAWRERLSGEPPVGELREYREPS